MRRGDTVSCDIQETEGWKAMAETDSRLHWRTCGGMKIATGVSTAFALIVSVLVSARSPSEDVHSFEGGAKLEVNVYNIRSGTFHGDPPWFVGSVEVSAEPLLKSGRMEHTFLPLVKSNRITLTLVPGNYVLHAVGFYHTDRKDMPIADLSFPIRVSSDSSLDIRFGYRIIPNSLVLKTTGPPVVSRSSKLRIYAIPSFDKEIAMLYRDGTNGKIKWHVQPREAGTVNQEDGTFHPARTGPQYALITATLNGALAKLEVKIK